MVYVIIHRFSMGCFILYIVIVLIFMPASPGIQSGDREVLEDLHGSLLKDWNYSYYWNNDTEPCGWSGISCD